MCFFFVHSLEKDASSERSFFAAARRVDLVHVQPVTRACAHHRGRCATSLYGAMLTRLDPVCQRDQLLAVLLCSSSTYLTRADDNPRVSM